MLAGNAYIEPLVVGERLRELHLLRPDRVSIIEGEDGWPVGYDYRAEGRAIRRIASERDGLGLLHLKLFIHWTIGPGSRHLLRRARLSICTMPQASGTNVCSTIPLALPVHWSISQRRVAISRPSNMSG